MTETITLKPNGQQGHTHTLIFLHGLGDTGNGWKDAMQMMRDAIPGLKVILPTAPIRSVTLNLGMQMTAWYDIQQLSADAQEDEEGILNSVQYLHNLIDQEVEEGISAGNIFVGGFSQGAAISLFGGLSYDKSTLAGIVALSSYLPLRQHVTTRMSSKNQKTPIVMCHGKSDGIIQPQWAQRSVEGLKQPRGDDAPLSFEWYSGMGHSACVEELKFILSWIQKQLS